MKFILFVEGETEKKALPAFLQKWLDARLSKRVGIDPVKFNGWQELVKDIPKKAGLYLNGPPRHDIIAVIALLDLYGPTFYPAGKETAPERYEWAKAHLESKVGHPKFHQFFAVHETEAWLLSDPNLFPNEVKIALPGKIHVPKRLISINRRRDYWSKSTKKNQTDLQKDDSRQRAFQQA